MPQKILENQGNLGKAMIAAGYSPATAKTPQNVTKSKSWPELLEKYFPDTKLLSTHNEILTEAEDLPRLRALDMAYKLKSKYPATAVDVSGSVAVVKVVKYSLDDLDKPIDAEVVK